MTNERNETTVRMVSELTAAECEGGSWVAVAAELCIIGRVPAKLATTLGNGRDFILRHNDGMRAEYRQPRSGMRLLVDF